MDKKDIDDKLMKIWEEEPARQPEDKKEASWNTFSAKVFPVRKKRIRSLKYAVAALLIISLSITAALIFSGTYQQSELAYNIVENPTGKVKQVYLPDSSSVELDPGARISYSDDFSGNREIRLTGNAFFKVEKDPQHPFKVVCGETTTMVLGTSFTIATNHHNIINVKLYEGRVRMNVKNSKHNWILSPGEQFTYNNKSVSVSAFNRFQDFDNEKMSSIIQYIEKSYGYSVAMPEEYLRKEITLRINRKEELPNIVNVIAQMYNLQP